MVFEYIDDGQMPDHNQRRPAHKVGDPVTGQNGGPSDPVTGFHRRDPLAPDRLRSWSEPCSNDNNHQMSL